MSRRSPWASLPTEAIHPGSAELDLLDPAAVLELMAREDGRAVEAVAEEAPRIERAARLMAGALGSGGRVYFAGAGTSGRLGVLEAAECPPTFGTAPERIVALVAGGDRSVFRSREGAEDDESSGAERLREKRLAKGDLVIGLTASGVTPFVRGALGFARERGAPTVLVTCGRRVRGIADVVVAPAVGPELLAGSTRMKSGTATKLVLNRITLLAMIRLNKIFGPYMVDLRPGSAKLRDRAARIVAALGEVTPRKARELLSAAGDVKTAVVMARLRLDVPEARKRLKRARGDLRRALERRS